MNGLSPEQWDRGHRRLIDTLNTWGPVCSALVEADRAMREARFILLGGQDMARERLAQAVKVLEAGMEKTQAQLNEEVDLEDGGW